MLILTPQMQYLKDEQYYIDLYDLSTIKECLGYKERAFADNLPEFKGKKLSPEQAKSIKQGLTDFMLYFIKGDRYRNKASTIREWMDRDSQEQIEKFSQKAKLVLENLKFIPKQAIIRKVVDTIIATQRQLRIRGYLPVEEIQNVKSRSESRNSGSAKCGEVHPF